MCVCACMYACLCACRCTRVLIWLYMCALVWRHVCALVWIHMCALVWMYMWALAWMHVCAHWYEYTWIHVCVSAKGFYIKLQRLWYLYVHIVLGALHACALTLVFFSAILHHIFWNLFLFMCRCMSFCTSHACVSPQRPEEVFRSHQAGVAGCYVVTFLR